MDDVTSNALASVALGRAIRDRRLELGMTVEVCAVTAGVAVKTLSRIEAGEDVRFTTLSRIAEALGLTAELTETVPRSPTKPAKAS